MGTLNDVRTEVAAIFATKWQKREGQVVPEPENVLLGNDAVTLKGTVLYADLAQSTQLVQGYKDFFAAEVYKSYLVTACRIIRSDGGVITAFDGDRVMAVYLGDAKNSNAARSALKINWAVKNVINPAIKQEYPNTSYEVSQVIGIDTSPLFVAKTGIRGSNDLVWVGRAANYAAKLCSIREPTHSSYLTEDVFNQLNETSKLGGNPKRTMWEKVTWTETGLTIYRSSWWWALT
jgi:class 3 adenylate cyclase